MLAHKALIVNHFMSGAPSHEIKDEPQSGAGCVADAFMNVRAELLQKIFGKRLQFLRKEDKINDWNKRMCAEKDQKAHRTEEA